MQSSEDNEDNSLMVGVDEIVRKTLNERLPGLIGESYVAEPKQFSLVSELVSQQTKTAHAALYHEEIESLNNTSAELDTADRSGANSQHSVFRSLKLDETYNLNAKWLHELYFANCFDSHSEIYMDSLAYMRLERDWGDFDTWQNDFIACAMSAGEGWAVCGYNMQLQRYVNTFISHHSGDVQLGLFPVLVVDMWSHAYFRDHMSDSKSYLVSQMRETNWNVVEQRINKAEAIHEVLKR